MFWKKEANMMVSCGETDKALHYYNLALGCAPEQAIELKRECFDAMADIYFKSNEFTQCIEYGNKGYHVKPVKNEVRVLYFYSVYVTVER